MKIAKLALLLCIISNAAYAEALAEPTDELLYTLKDSLVKVTTATKSGGHGFGTGVAISKDHVVTNCHVLSNASGIGISRWGVEYTPVSLQADWRHDICILKFEWADLKPVKIADSDILQYEQAIISISMPSDSPAPYVALSAVNSGSDFPTTKLDRTFLPPLDSAIKGIKPAGSGSGFRVSMFTCTHNAAVSM